MALNVNNQQLQIAINQTNQLPAEGSLCIPVRLDFTNTPEWDLDLLNFFEQGRISLIQTAFVDNSNNSNPFTITCQASGMSLVVPPNSQGFFPLLVPNPPRFAFTTLQGSGVVTVQLLNTMIPGPIWSVL